MIPSWQFFVNRFTQFMDQKYPNEIIDDIDSFKNAVAYRSSMQDRATNEYHVPWLYNWEWYIIDGYISPLYYSENRDEVIWFSISLVWKDDWVSIDFR